MSQVNNRGGAQSETQAGARERIIFRGVASKVLDSSHGPAIDHAASHDRVMGRACLAASGRPLLPDWDVLGLRQFPVCVVADKQEYISKYLTQFNRMDCLGSILSVALLTCSVA